MCWLCEFTKTNPTEKQSEMARLLFSRLCDLLDECAQLPTQNPRFEYACTQASRLFSNGKRKPEKISESIGRAIVEEMQKTFGPDVEIELVGSESLTANQGRRATDNVLQFKGKLDHATQVLFDAIETPTDGKVH